MIKKPLFLERFNCDKFLPTSICNLEEYQVFVKISPHNSLTIILAENIQILKFCLDNFSLLRANVTNHFPATFTYLKRSIAKVQHNCTTCPEPGSKEWQPRYVVSTAWRYIGTSLYNKNTHIAQSIFIIHSVIKLLI